MNDLKNIIKKIAYKLNKYFIFIFCTMVALLVLSIPILFFNEYIGFVYIATLIIIYACIAFVGCCGDFE